MKWSKSQNQAICEVGHNLLISAGAGSGKTAVLTSRVINLLENNVSLKELLILTFTKAAAMEMKERIRLKLKDMPSLKDELLSIDEAFIMTFDAFALYLVKKYHYLLNMPRDIVMSDASLISILKNECMRKVFDDFYEKGDASFLKFIDVYCAKDDDGVIKQLLSIYDKLVLKPDVVSYLDGYEANFGSDDFIDEVILAYEDLVLAKKNDFLEALLKLREVFDGDYMAKVDEVFFNFFKANSYNDLWLVMDVTMPRLPSKTPLEIKSLKDEASKVLKELKSMFRFGSLDDLRSDYLRMMDVNKVIVMLLKNFHLVYEEERIKRGYIDFTVVLNSAVQLIKDHKDILLELRSNFKEIMVDEYQDTNDIQEAFISLLMNDNVYMVGDVKQSIYRFRNANPKLFTLKYLSYSANNGGSKIDLADNFRTRKEVLQDINMIFNLLMDDYLGGADYFSLHQMKYGNLVYDELKSNIDSHMEIFTYDEDDVVNEEVEAFFIGRKIKSLIASGLKVVDFNNHCLREACYGDFCILMDRSTSFITYQKIFNYLHIPLHVYLDEKLRDNEHFSTLKNIFIVIYGMYLNKVDDDFKLAFVSLARGFLFNLSDEDIYYVLKNNDFKNSVIWQRFLPILDGFNGKSLSMMLDDVLELSNYYDCMCSLGNVKEGLLVIESVNNLLRNMDNYGYGIFDLISYFMSLDSQGIEVKRSSASDSFDSVSLMSIHRSKGLEFPVCFYSGLYKKFNIEDIKDGFLWDSSLGFIAPIYKYGIMATFMKDLLKDKFMADEVSEKIRLFYVALTRAKEKIYFVMPNKYVSDSVDKDGNVIRKMVRQGFRSFAHMLGSLGPYLKDYRKFISLDELKISKDYLKISDRDKFDYDEGILNVSEYDHPLKMQKTFAKKMTSLVRKEDIDLGILFHETLRYVDFKNPNYDLIDNEFVSKKVRAFCESKFICDLGDCEFYTEYEFYDENNHGVIDLMILKGDEVIIVDYKLKNVKSNDYLKQLNGYKNYASKAFNLPVRTYLYSIIDEKFYAL